MIKGLYTAATALVALERSHDVTANNIAHASTSGFRAQKPVQKGFYEVFAAERANPARFDLNSAPGGGTKLIETFTDTRSGQIAKTGNPLNVALSGPGFLVVETPNGQRYLRNGAFSIDADGELATPDGLKILGEGGPIQASGGPVTITADGTINVGNENMGKLQLVEFEDPHMLTREGEGLFVASDAAIGRSAPAEKTTVTHEALEMSNVNLPQEMINMILGLRAYGANQKVITAMDETMGRLIEQVGMPA